MTVAAAPPSDPQAGVLGLAEGAIDVHAHFMPRGYAASLEAVGLGRPDGIPALPSWEIGRHLEDMDRMGIATALLSISSPGVLLPTPAATVALARAVNDEGANAVRAHPGRFGSLASLPLPHVASALEELTRAFDELGADGIALTTNYGGRYVGDPAFREVLAELDRRRALVLLHPVAPPNAESVALGRPVPMLEFPFETTRAVADLVLSGATTRHPGIRWIVSHAGAALPVLAARIAWVAELLETDGAGIDVDAELGRLHYDTAGTPLPIALPALIALVGERQLLYGSDMTFTPTDAVVPLAEALRDSGLFGAAGWRATLRGHAEQLIPRLGGRS